MVKTVLPFLHFTNLPFAFLAVYYASIKDSSAFHTFPIPLFSPFSRWFLQTDYFCFEIQGTAVCLTGPFPVQGKVFSISD
jgi:hypothetical protein